MAVLSDHRYMRSGFAFLTDGMETQGILLALTSKSVYSIVLRRALSFEERVSIDGQSINSCWEKGSPSLWATRAHVGCAALQNMEPCDCSTNRLESSSAGICFSMSVCNIFVKSKHFTPFSCFIWQRLNNVAIIFFRVTCFYLDHVF